MKAVCPNNENHKKFTTTAHVCQEWLVDENGNYIEVSEDCLDVTHSPNICNIWICNICGATAIVK